MENKKKQVKKINYNTTEQEEIKKFLVVIVVVLAICGGLYLLTRAFVTKDLFSKEEDKTEEVAEGKVDYNVAIMGQIFNRPYTEYYVAIYNAKDGKYMSDMASLLYSYSNKENKDKNLHMYTVDLSNHLNADYYDPENVNTKAQSVADMKVGDITLLKIKNKKITKYIVDYDAMKKELDIK